MKILELKIINKTRTSTLREIKFRESGTTYILGDVSKTKKYNSGTINSLGKTILLRLIKEYYGSPYLKPHKDIESYYTEAKISLNGVIYRAEKKIGSSEYEVDGVQYLLADYIRKMTIHTKDYSYMYNTEPRLGLLSKHSKNPSKNDIEAYLRLLSLGELIENTDKIYELQDSLKLLKNTRKKIIDPNSSLSHRQISSKIKDLDTEISNIEATLSELNTKSREIKNNITSLSMANVSKDLIAEYESLRSNYKHNQLLIEMRENDNRRIQKYTDKFKPTSVTNDDILTIYDRADIEIPKSIRRSLEDAYNFHQNIYKDRLAIAKNKIKANNRAISDIEILVSAQESRMNELSKILSQNKAYEESIEIYSDISKRISEASYRKGELSDIEKINTNIQKKDVDLSFKFAELAESFLEESISKKITDYRSYIVNLIRYIYGNDRNASFKISSRDRHAVTRPINVEFNITGDDGEGVDAVKKLSLDCLIFNYTEKINFLAEDSSCFNGIDPRQIEKILRSINEVSHNNNKQSFICMNRFQMDENDFENLSKINEEYGIVLSETTSQKLFKKEF